MKISDLLKKLSGRDPDDELDVKSLEQSEQPEQPQDEQEVNDEKTEVIEDQPEQQEIVEQQEVIEEKSEEPKPVVEDQTAEIESLKAKIAELESAAETDKAALRAAEAKSRLDAALQAGWLTPAMLKESETDDSVFVTLAKEYPDLFDRLQLIMSPKSIPKPLLTEAPVEGINTVMMSDDELYNRISALAKEKNISYAEAAKLLR